MASPVPRPVASRSRQARSAVLACAWSVVVVLQVRALLVVATEATDVADEGSTGLRTLLTALVAGCVVVAVAGAQRARAGSAELRAGGLRAVAVVSRVLLALVVLLVLWAAMWVVGDPGLLPQVVGVTCAAAPCVTAELVVRRLRALPAGVGQPVRVAGGLVGASLVPFLVAGMLLLASGALTG